MRHGSRTSYQHGCRCEACCRAERSYRARRAAGRAGFVDAAPVRQRLEALVAAGMRKTWIATAAGVDYCTVYNIANGRYATVQRATAAAIMAVRGTHLTDQQYVPVAETLRRLEELYAAGYSQAWAREKLGVCGLPNKRSRFCRLWMARRVEALYEEYAGTVGTCRDGTPIGKRKAKGVRLATPKDPQQRATLAIDAAAVDMMLDACGYELAAVLEAAAISSETWYQIRRGRKVTEATAERLARALGSRLAAIVREEVAA